MNLKKYNSLNSLQINPELFWLRALHSIESMVLFTTFGISIRALFIILLKILMPLRFFVGLFKQN